MRQWFCLFLFLSGSTAFAERTDIRVPATPTLSPDGNTLVFEWNDDLWKVSINGGRAEQLTTHPARDCWAEFSPDGSEIAFMSKRDGTWQAHVIPAEGGTARQLTWNSEGCNLCDWFPDGKSILIQADRDHAGSSWDVTRLFRINRDERKAEQLCFNAAAKNGKVSPDGSKILFTSDGVELYRKGYSGSSCSKIWMYDTVKQSYQLVCDDPGGNRSPLWKPDSSGFYFVCAKTGTFNIWEHNLKSDRQKQLTKFKDDSVILPCISRNGKMMVFRNLFDFYRFDPASDKEPERIDIWTDSDNLPQKTRKRWFSSAWNGDRGGSVSFTDDGLEIALTCGGDVWVMDSVLREAVQVTSGTSMHDTEAMFSPDGSAILFLRDEGHTMDIWKAGKSDTNKYWWVNRDFNLSRITDDGGTKSQLSISPDGKLLAYVRNRGQLCISDSEGNNEKTLLSAPFKVYYDWSPDSKWLTCMIADSSGNRDVFIVPADGSQEPYNISRHPNWDGAPRWSPDGRIIAFIGSRYDNETDIFYVYLQQKDENLNNKERDLEEALKKMDSERIAPEKDAKQDTASENTSSSKEHQKVDAPKTDVRIDFEGLADRIHRVSIPDAVPSGLFWSYDSKALAFSATINGKNGTYKIVFPNDLSPQFMTEKTGSYAKWTEKALLWSVENTPYAYTVEYPFKAWQEINIAEYRRLGFRMAWRKMRDNFYDKALNNLDWNVIRLKYEDMAAQSINHSAFSRIITMMLGELNASHTGFIDTTLSSQEWEREWDSKEWKERTAHPGLLFDPEHPGPGLKISRVIKGGPADKAGSKVLPGEILLSVDRTAVEPGYDLTRILNGRWPRRINLRIKAADGTERDVSVFETDYKTIRELIREEEVLCSRDMVSRLSRGTAGYLNIERMQWADLREFERKIFSEGNLKDGLIIDVRNNTGGFVADRILSILCRPQHAFCVPRDGERSYPSEYYGYTVWNKPVVVLCNQNSVSNAEIFSHAVKTLKRGKVVGVQTQGGVIAMPRENILDLGELCIPEWGFFTLDGRDMEMKGAVPDYVVRPEPGDPAKGIDHQLEKAVDVLLDEIKEYKSRKLPELIKASETRKQR